MSRRDDRLGLRLCNPALEEFLRVRRIDRRRADHHLRVLGEDGPDPHTGFRREAHHVIVPAQEGIATVAGHMNILHGIVDRQRVEWQVALDEAAVRLSGQRRQIVFQRIEYPRVQPRRYVHEWPRRGILKHQQVNDPLGPGGATLGIGGDHDVVGARLEGIPAPGIHHRRAKRPGRRSLKCRHGLVPLNSRAATLAATMRRRQQAPL